MKDFNCSDGMRDCCLWPPLARHPPEEVISGSTCVWSDSESADLEENNLVYGFIYPFDSPARAYMFFFSSRSMGFSANAWITGSRKASEWRTRTPCLLSWSTLNICSGLPHSPWWIHKRPLRSSCDAIQSLKCLGHILVFCKCCPERLAS